LLNWGTGWRQRLRLAPLYLAMLAADRWPARSGVPAAALPRWAPGISVIIPERDTPAILAETLAAVDAARARVDEPTQVIVVVNGAAVERYAELARRHADIEWMHASEPLGFGGAIARGLARVQHDWVYLLNSDMRLDADALAALLPWRRDDVFALGSQIFQASADGRREETGFVDWYVDPSGIRAYHAGVRDEAVPYPQLCAGGGAALFRTALLRRYVRSARCYDPFYWEDADWGVQAWREGLAVLFCPHSRANHLHRATTARFYAAAELERIVERNRLLFDARHAASGEDPARLLERVCALPYASQRELARPGIAAAVLDQRRRARSSGLPLAPLRLRDDTGLGIVLTGASYGCRLRAGLKDRPARPRVLLVTPFAIFPPRHGGARRIAELVRALRETFDIVVVSDEASLYDARSLSSMDGLFALHLVERGRDGQATDRSLPARMGAHGHARLVAAVQQAVRDHAPAIVQIEYAELADLVRMRGHGQRWVLGLHDAVTEADCGSAAAYARFTTDCLARYDAVTVCSEEDGALTSHPATVCVPNGSAVPLADYRASTGVELVFVGPFRYGPNLDGVWRFLRDAWPAIKAAAPATRLTVLGGDESAPIVAADPMLRQQDVTVLGHREDVTEILRRAVLTINPLTGIRGSAVKLIESLTAGRICVSTEDGARGFSAAGFAGLVTVRDVAAMAPPIVALLTDAQRRHALERADRGGLEAFQWPQCAAIQRALYDRLLEDNDP
jgi:GT2 family glycosyltransferase